MIILEREQTNKVSLQQKSSMQVRILPSCFGLSRTLEGVMPHPEPTGEEMQAKAERTPGKTGMWVRFMLPRIGELGSSPHFIIMETEITDFNREMSQEERAYYGTHYDGER